MTGRNQPCPCGSGKKYKRCHGASPGGGPARPPRRTGSAASTGATDPLDAAGRLLAAGQYDAAWETARHAPDSVRRCEALVGILLARDRDGDRREATRLIGEWRRLAPRSPEPETRAFELAIREGDDDRLGEVLRRLSRLAPDHALTHYYRGVAAQRSGRLDEALNAYAQAAQRQFPDYAPDSIAVLAAGKAVDTAIGRHPGSDTIRWSRLPGHPAVVAALERALERLEETSPPRDPAERGWLASAWYKLAAARRQALVDAEACRAACERTLALNPDHDEARSTLLFTLNYDTRRTPQERYRAHLAGAEHWARQPTRPSGSFRNPRDPDRVLRVAYLSADFRHHPVSYFILPVLANHDPDRVLAFAYHLHPSVDEYTGRAEAAAHRYLHAAGVDDATLARALERDRIDILVDLNGTSGVGRLALLARRAAPVQITWLGSPHTTGLAAVDYRIVDERTDPPPDAQAWNRERLLYLPRQFSVYDPLTELPAVGPAPCLANGYVTFGSCNNVAKIHPELLDCWADVLRTVPESRLLLKYPALDHEPVRRAVSERLERNGIEPGRIECVGRIPGRYGHLDAYGRIDIQLDTYPYHGTTTTCESLMMGVPVVTRVGPEHRSRVGLSLLHTVGHPEWAAADRDGYIETAKNLAADPEALGRIRAGLRQDTLDSPLTDAARFTRELEDAYRRCWARWCDEAD